jgi:hypothetical protein
MNVPDATRVAVLVGRARRAGVTGASGFADWLIIDEEWFGPCADMDAWAYRRWRRRAIAMYIGPHDAYVSSGRMLPPRARRAITPSGPADAAVRSVLILLSLLLVVALAGVSRAVRDVPPGVDRTPAERTTQTCTGLYRTACEPM